MENTIKALERKGYKVTVFSNGGEAVQYLRNALNGLTIGFGGSQTLTELDLRHILAENNTVYVPDFPAEGETFSGSALKAFNANVFLLSANAISDDGDIINIDGTGNRLAGSLFGHDKVIYIVGRNKFGGTLEEAIRRARNIAGPKNALRLRCKTPCAMAVVKDLEMKFREEYHTDGPIDQLEWQSFLAKLDSDNLNTHCYDCKSPNRICGSLLIHMKKPYGMDAEVVIIDEDLGF
ncbi:MAG: lactate utilization protein [Lachnospiraceae bacterium]|nr:lactate utilization protein [Lachnospiraceae bacterium]